MLTEGIKGAKQFEFTKQRPDEANKETLICWNDFIFTPNKRGEGLFKEEGAPPAGEENKPHEKTEEDRQTHGRGRSGKC